MVARSDPAHRSDICLKRPGWTGEVGREQCRLPGASLPARHQPDGNIDSLVVTGDGRPRTQAYLSAGTAWYQSYQMVLLRLRAHRQQPIAIALRGRKAGMEDPSKKPAIRRACQNARITETIGDSSGIDGEKFADDN